MRLLQDGNPDVFAQWMKTASSSIIARGGKSNGPKLLLSWFKGEQETTNSSLKPPEGLDIDTLIKSTEEAFEVIVPGVGFNQSKRFMPSLRH